MGSCDESQLRFEATRLPVRIPREHSRGLDGRNPWNTHPELPAGWKRDFLLFVDGWAKDGDANTAYSQSVEPLPFHGMSQYPYSSRERFPDGEWRKQYTTRPALRLLRQLTR